MALVYLFFRFAYAKLEDGFFLKVMSIQEILHIRPEAYFVKGPIRAYIQSGLLWEVNFLLEFKGQTFIFKFWILKHLPYC